MVISISSIETSVVKFIIILPDQPCSKVASGNTDTQINAANPVG